MRQQFEARKGNRVLYFWAEDIHNAYEQFDGFFSKARKYLSYDWYLQAAGKGSNLIDFLADCGAKGAAAKIERRANQPVSTPSVEVDATKTPENESSAQQTYIMSKQTIPKEVSEYMAKIGSTGGKKGKGTAERKARAAKAGKARWDKWKQQQKEEKKCS